MIFDQHVRPMSPFHTTNHGRRYNYYVSHNADDPSIPAQRLPAGELETAVRKTVADWLAISTNTRQLRPNLDTLGLARMIERCRDVGGELERLPLAGAREIQQTLRLKVMVTANGITADFDANALLGMAGVPSGDARRIDLRIPASSASYGHEPRLRLDPPSGTITSRDQRLVELIARAFTVRDQLVALSEDEVAAMPATTLRHLERVARLAYLEPAIITAILDGTQPRKLSARELSRMASLPQSWTEQRKVLGFEPD